MRTLGWGWRRHEEYDTYLLKLVSFSKPDTLILERNLWTRSSSRNFISLPCNSSSMTYFEFLEWFIPKSCNQIIRLHVSHWVTLEPLLMGYCMNILPDYIFAMINIKIPGRCHIFFLLSLEIRWHKSSNFVLIFKKCVYYSKSF